MSSAQAILNRAKNSQRTEKREPKESTNTRFYVRRWSASKSEMEEVRQFIRDKRRANSFGEKNLSDKRLEEIKKRIVRK